MPDGKITTWRLRSNEDLHRNFDCHARGDCALKDLNTMNIYTKFVDLEEGRLYEVLPAASEACIKVSCTVGRQSCSCRCSTIVIPPVMITALG